MRDAFRQQLISTIPSSHNNHRAYSLYTYSYKETLSLQMAYYSLRPEPTTFFNDLFDIRPIVAKRQVKNDHIDPPIDIYQSSDGSLTFLIDLPGVKNSDVSVNVNEKNLVISAERKKINFLTCENEKEQEKETETEREILNEKIDEIKTEDKQPVSIERQCKTEIQNVTPSKTEAANVATKPQDGYYIQKQILSGCFKKVFQLSSKHDTQNIKAKLSNGILKVVVPILKENAPKIYRINVE